MNNTKHNLHRLCGLFIAIIMCTNIPLFASNTEEFTKGFENIFGASIFICLLYLLIVISKLDWIKLSPVVLLFASAFVVRLILAAMYKGHLTDMSCWSGWATAMAEHGPIHFYDSMDFADYPPGYMLILWPIGILLKNFGVPSNPALYSIILKLPIFIFDMLAGIVIYKYAVKKNFVSPLFLAGALLFNPAVLFSSAIWGQVDMVLCFFVIGMIIAFYEGKLTLASLAFVGGLLIKPQMFLFGPVFIIGYIYYFKGRTLKSVMHDTLVAASIAIATFLAIFIPFIVTKGDPLWILELYFSTMGSYAYGSVNAINLISLLGGLWAPDTDLFMGVSYKTIGSWLIILSIAYTFFLAIRDKSRKNFSLYAGLMILSIFTVGHHMHERYIFPALICMFVSYMYVPKRSTLVFMLYFSVLQVLNMALVLQNVHLFSDMPFISLLSLAQVCGFIAFCSYCFMQSSSKDTESIDKASA